MMYYGTDITRHFKDVHELLADVHEGLARVAAARPTSGPLERIAALAAWLRHRVLSWHYRQSFRIASLHVGSAYLAQGSLENACLEFFHANERYPVVGLKYLGQARLLETARSPHAQAFYLLEEGGLKRSPGLLAEAMGRLDPFWEKEAIAAALVKLVPLLSGTTDRPRQRDAVQGLFEINPGAMPQAGIGLPLEVSFKGDGWGGRDKRLISRYLKRAHSEVAAGMRHALDLARQPDGSVRFSVTDGKTGRTVAQGSAEGGPARIAQAVLDELYAVR